MSATATRLLDQLETSPDASICLSWELTYAGNLACGDGPSSSGGRDPHELTTAYKRGLWMPSTPGL
jgi:hypothetical protein